LTPEERAAREESRRAAALALAAGCVDAYALMTFGVFASFMSGNTTSAGVRAGAASATRAAHHFLPIPAFVAGAFVAALLFRDVRRSVRPLSGLTLGGLVAGALATALAPRHGWLGVLALAFSMGVLSSTIRRVGGQVLNVGFVTGDLIKLGAHLALAARRAPVSDCQGAWDTHAWRAIVLTRIWACLLAGAVFAGAAGARLGVLVLLLPAAILVAVVLGAAEPAVRC
jgi:uncharacterized membrane protein YoaK (UPF0700 family)